MKKLFLALLVTVLSVFLITSSVYASATNLWNENYIVGQPSQDGFEYNDSSLASGFYTFSIGSPTLTAQPSLTYSTFTTNSVQKTFTQAFTNTTYLGGVFSGIVFIYDGHFSVRFLNSSSASVFSEGTYNIVLSYLDETDPVFSYTSLTYETSYADPITVAEIQAELSVFDNVDGDLTDDIIVDTDEYTGNETTLGDYDVIFSVSDSSDNISYITVTVTVVDDVAPALSGFGYEDYLTSSSCSYDENGVQSCRFFYDFIIDLNVDVLSSELENMFLSITGSDVSIDISDGYLTRTFVDFTNAWDCGSYQQDVLDDIDYQYSVNGTTYFEVSDYTPLYWMDVYENATYIDWTVTIIPRTPPIFYNDGFLVDSAVHFAIDFPYSQIADPATYIYTYFTAWTCDIYQSGVLVSDLSIADMGDLDILIGNVVGVLGDVLNLSFTTTDEYGSSTTIYVDITLVDDIAPEFDSAPVKIVKPLSAIFTTADITALIIVSDNYDIADDLTLTILSNTYVGHENYVGRYEIEYQVEDTSGNTETYIVVVWVVDVTAPLVTVQDDFLVTVSINSPIELSMLPDLLESYGIVITSLAYDITVLSDDYTGSETVVGSYEMVLQLDFEDESQEIITLSLNVVPDIHQFDDEPVPSTLSINILGLGALAFGVLFVGGMLIYKKQKSSKYRHH